jgi:hypothetical protein
VMDVGAAADAAERETVELALPKRPCRRSAARGT